MTLRCLLLLIGLAAALRPAHTIAMHVHGASSAAMTSTCCTTGSRLDFGHGGGTLLPGRDRYPAPSLAGWLRYCGTRRGNLSRDLRRIISFRVKARPTHDPSWPSRPLPPGTSRYRLLPCRKCRDRSGALRHAERLWARPHPQIRNRHVPAADPHALVSRKARVIGSPAMIIQTTRPRTRSSPLWTPAIR